MAACPAQTLGSLETTNYPLVDPLEAALVLVLPVVLCAEVAASMHWPIPKSNLSDDENIPDAYEMKPPLLPPAKMGR